MIHMILYLTLGLALSFVFIGIALLKLDRDVQKLRKISDEREGKNRKRAMTIHAAIKNLERPTLRNRELTRLVRLANDPQVENIDGLVDRLNQRSDQRPRHG